MANEIRVTATLSASKGNANLGSLGSAQRIEECVFRFAGASLYAKADTAACDVQYAMLED